MVANDPASAKLVFVYVKLRPDPELEALEDIFGAVTALEAISAVATEELVSTPPALACTTPAEAREETVSPFVLSMVSCNVPVAVLLFAAA